MSARVAPPASTTSTAVSALSLDLAMALARGGTVSTAADSIGVWFNSYPNLKQAIEEIRREWNALCHRRGPARRRASHLRHNSTELDTFRHFRRGNLPPLSPYPKHLTPTL